MNRARLLDWTVLIALVAVWGSAFAAVKLAVETLPPAWVAASRLWIGAATLLPLMLWRGERTPPLRDPRWGWYAGVGVLGTALPFFLFAYASVRLPSAVVAIFNGSTPVTTALLAHAALGGTDKLTTRRTLGVALGFLGVAVLVGPAALRMFDPDAAFLAQAAALLGAVGYSIGAVLTRRAPATPAVTGAFMFCLVGALAATPLAWAQGGPPAWPGWTAALCVLFLGVGPTGVASAAWVWLIHRRGPLFPAFATYLAPVWATGMGVLLLGERPGAAAYLALAIILGGVVVANSRRRPAPGAAGSPAP